MGGPPTGVFVAPKNLENTETKHQSGAVPILLLASLTLTAGAGKIWGDGAERVSLMKTYIPTLKEGWAYWCRA
jgi:hypothetical protein